MLVCISIVIANKNNEDSKSFKCWLLKIKTSQVLVKTFAIDFAGEVNNFRDSVLVRHSERCLSSLSTASLPVSLQERLPSSGIETRGTIRSSTGGGTAGGDCWEFLRCLFTTHINWIHHLLAGTIVGIPAVWCCWCSDTSFVNQDSKAFKCWLMKRKISQVLLKTCAINFSHWTFWEMFQLFFTSISAGISGGTTSICLAQGIALLVVIVGSLLDAFSLPTSYKCTCPSTVPFNRLLAVTFAGLQTVGYCQCSDTSLVKRNTSTKEKIQIL